MTDFKKIAETMAPEKALSEIVIVVRELLFHVSEETVYDFVGKLIGDEGDSKVGNLVHL